MFLAQAHKPPHYESVSGQVGTCTRAQRVVQKVSLRAFDNKSLRLLIIYETPRGPLKRISFVHRNPCSILLFHSDMLITTGSSPGTTLSTELALLLSSGWGTHRRQRRVPELCRTKIQQRDAKRQENHNVFLMPCSAHSNNPLLRNITMRSHLVYSLGRGEGPGSRRKRRNPSVGG